MILTFTVTVTVERTSGKFISKENIAEQIQDALANADPNEIEVDESFYQVTDWQVDLK